MCCRRIEAGDVEAVVRLLARGFPARSVGYWARALDRLSRHAARVGADAFGQLMESDGVPVGVLLLIHGTRGAAVPRCNLSSWYVEPAFQGYAPLLVARAAKDKAATFFNISPAAHVRPIIEAQGFRRYGTGRFWSVPALGPSCPNVRVGPLRDAAGIADPREREIVETHAGYGCLSLRVATPDGTLPFVVLPRLTKGLIPSAQLIYCRDVTDFVRWSGPIGRFLLRRGMPVVAIDADGPIPGLAGRFVADDCPKYFKGPAPPRLGDMTDTELVMFGP